MSDKPKRHIIVRENDKIIYEGPDNRQIAPMAMVQAPRFFGLSPDTWIKIGGFAIAMVLFYYRTDDFMRSQKAINEYQMKFSQNSDAYHSAITGRAFEQGRPAGWGERRDNFNPIKSAYAGEHNREEQ